MTVVSAAKRRQSRQGPEKKKKWHCIEANLASRFDLPKKYTKTAAEVPGSDPGGPHGLMKASTRSNGRGYKFHVRRRGWIRRPSTRRVATRRVPSASGDMIERSTNWCAPAASWCRRLGASRPAKRSQAHGPTVSKVRKLLRSRREPIAGGTPSGEEGRLHLRRLHEDKAVVQPFRAVITLNLKEQTYYGAEDR